MVEDRTFTVDKIPHVVDFKSGFGSNEKGNMLRLIAVGRAYRLWNPSTRLLLLVRQPINNNYLRVIERANLWEVFCGEAAYHEIDRLTGANTIELRRDIIDFEKDLNQSFWNYLKQQPTDLTSYLSW